NGCCGKLVHPASVSPRSLRNCVTLCDLTRRNSALRRAQGARASGNEEWLEGPSGRYPELLLTGHRRDVFEVGVIVQDYRSIVFGDRRGQQIHDSSRSMLATG